MARTTGEILAEVEENVNRLQNLLRRTESNPRPVAIMMCGIAGSGKSTYAKTIARLHPNFQRLSIDQILADQRGLVGIDFPESKYEEYQDEAGVEFVNTLQELLSGGAQDVIIDRSFYAKEDREEYRRLIDQCGGRCVLLHLRAPKDVLWQRIRARREANVNADSALDISEQLLDDYYEGFEWPQGEGEVVIETSSSK